MRSRERLTTCWRVRRRKSDTERPALPSRRGSRAYISVFSFPDTMEGVLFLNEGDFVDGRTLLDTVLGEASEWTAPRWADTGDVAFYYYSTRALTYVRRVRRHFALIGALTQEVEEYLARAEQDAVEYGGTIVSYEFATGRAVRRRGEAGGGGHRRTPHYVKCAGGQTLERPLRPMDHRDELPVPYGGTILSLQPAQFRRLVSLLQKAGNRLSDRLRRVVPRTESRHAADAASWRIVGCAPETRFKTEAELGGPCRSSARGDQGPAHCSP